MDRVYSYAILQAAPDARRNERVNIGLVVLKEDGLDIQVVESRKIRALTGQSWDALIDSYSKALRAVDDPSANIEERLIYLNAAEGEILLSASGWFKAFDQEQYDARINEIVDAIIARPSSRKPKEDTSIVAEISADLRRAKILATKEDTLATGKVVRNYRVDVGLEADFAQLNSRLHVASVLDLRSAHPQLAQAALKAVVLDRAAASYDGNIHKIGVYAVAPARRQEVIDNITLLERYSDDLVNWEDPSDQRGLKKIFFDAYNSHVDGHSN
ncbi:DUF3037 domain-containing protein [Mesorhizobium sp. M7A.F.Ca.US.008.03.1.1]|uniref:DUF3037 domain-containing protein n=1 Tax=Mesorhizobium sp. M7A.F.Ca.US.008.03.1.1 TaxID=2496742 RepID=UPI000FCB66EF|nr:DUF3037 domain-containing protein [Mesorhizobium sp. M7A.F.Ca.US.008.03.1.1]RUW61572.1 DUF3037 domain-containing protein [Mesorhizobium sp. M7A.F.Ca.US.008.03.1.1]